MWKFLLKILSGWVINILAIYVSSLVLDNFNFDGTLILIIVALGFSIVSAIARPFLKLLSIPFPIIGLVFLFVVNSFIIFLLGHYVKGFYPGDMVSILEASGIVTVMNFVLRLIIK